MTAKGTRVQPAIRLTVSVALILLSAVATSLREPDSVRQAALERIVRAVSAWHPDQVILFGSSARGDARPDSDLDVLVVLPTDALVTRDLVPFR